MLSDPTGRAVVSTVSYTVNTDYTVTTNFRPQMIFVSFMSGSTFPVSNGMRTALYMGNYDATKYLYFSNVSGVSNNGSLQAVGGSFSPRIVSVTDTGFTVRATNSGYTYLFYCAVE